MINRAALNQVSTEAMELLKEKAIVPSALQMLCWMSAARQVEAAKVMVMTGNFSRSFAQALLVASKLEDRVNTGARSIRGLSQGPRSKMQEDLERVLANLAVTDNYGANMLRLVAAAGYVSKLTKNVAIENYLSRNYPDLLQGLRAVIANVSLAGSNEEPLGADPGRSQPAQS